MSNLKQELQQHLNPRAWHWLLAVSEVAVDIGLPLYLVGGIVRDVLLGRGSLDLDLVVEGSGIKLAEAVHGRFGGQLTTHEKFGTANWRPENEPEIDIDFVTARTETYAHPAALPDVTPSSINQDLFRRDFTINAMAVRLDGDHLGEILDLYGGQQDLQDGLIRVLHDQSFVDDPTRLWRGIRFASRFGFPFAPDTTDLIEPGKAYLKDLSIDRIRHELELILLEQRPSAPLEMLAELDLYRASKTSLAWNDSVAHRWASGMSGLISHFGRLVLDENTDLETRLVLFLCQQQDPVMSAEQLHLSRKLQSIIAKCVELRSVLEHVSWEGYEPRPSDVANLLAPYKKNSLIGFVAAVGSHNIIAFDVIGRYYLEWRHVQPQIDGNGLRSLGLTPGPQFREILGELTAAWLDGNVHTAAEETALLQRILAKLDYS